MNIRSLTGKLWKSHPFLIPVPIAILWACRTWMRLSEPNVNDTGGWFDHFARVVMTAWTTVLVFFIVLIIVVWINSEIQRRKLK